MVGVFWANIKWASIPSVSQYGENECTDASALSGSSGLGITGSSGIGIKRSLIFFHQSDFGHYFIKINPHMAKIIANIMKIAHRTFLKLEEIWLLFYFRLGFGLFTSILS